MSDEDDQLDDRLIGNVREELMAQNAMQGLGLTQEKIDQVAWCIAVNLDNAFQVRWSPRWESGTRRG